MSVINYFAENNAQLFYIIAGASLLIDLAVLGLSGPLLFFAIGSALTGLLIHFGQLSGWEYQILSLGLLTALSAVVLWPPIKRFQNAGDGTDSSSDMIGKTVPSSSEITHTQGLVRYSGVDWSAKLAAECKQESVARNTSCIIVGVDGNVMLVKPA